VDRRQKTRTITMAQMTIAAMGEDGFDILMRLSRDVDNPKFMNVFYTTLGQTGDRRAFAVLRSAIADEGIHEGLKIQAISAMGQLFSISSREGSSPDLAESSQCVQILYPYLDSTSDQLVAVTLRTLARMVHADRDPRVRAAVLRFLRSESPDRRESSLDAMFTTDATWDSDTIALVKWMAASDPEPSCLATAQAVLDKYAAEVAQ
jgi:hypothetical protein